MLSLTIKDIRKVLEETLSKFYDFADYSVTPTRVVSKSKEFRIEFKIYDAGFWMEVDPAIDSIHIATRAFGDVDHIDSLQMWLSKPFEYDNSKFNFGWREDLEWFFDALHAYLKERVERAHNAPEPNVKIGPFNVDNLTNYLEKEEATSYEEYIENPPKTKFSQILDNAINDENKKSVLSQILDNAMHDENKKSVLSQILDKMYEEEPDILDKLYEEDAKVDKSKVGECKIASKPSIFNSLKDDEDEYI